MIEVIVHDAPTEREAVPLLLDALRDRNPRKADLIEDVYAEVLKGLRQDDIKDPKMVEWLMEALRHGFQVVAEPGYYFVRESDSYGYINLDKVESL